MAETNGASVYARSTTWKDGRTLYTSKDGLPAATLAPPVWPEYDTISGPLFLLQRFRSSICKACQCRRDRQLGTEIGGTARCSKRLCVLGMLRGLGVGQKP